MCLLKWEIEMSVEIFFKPIKVWYTIQYVFPVWALTVHSRKTLITIKDLEQLKSNYAHSIPLKYITSNITAGERIPNFNSSNIHGDSAASPWAVQLPQDGTYTWPLTLNGEEELHLGGFYVWLDGLTAYIAPW